MKTQERAPHFVNHILTLDAEPFQHLAAAIIKQALIEHEKKRNLQSWLESDDCLFWLSIAAPLTPLDELQGMITTSV